MKKINKIAPSTLRQKAEETLFEKPLSPSSKYSDSDADTLKLIHELEVRQIEFELQNEELMLAKEQTDSATTKYIELYDFAPAGYFQLSKTGEIIEVNLTGSTMLGKERLHLKGSEFNFFISDESKPIFNRFLEKTYNSLTKETCEVRILKNGCTQAYIHLSNC